MTVVMKYVVDALYIIVGVTTIASFAKRGLFESVFRFGRHIAAALISYLVGPAVSRYFSSRWIYAGIFDSVSQSLHSLVDSTAGALDLQTVIAALPPSVKMFIDPAAMEEKYGSTIENMSVLVEDFAASVSTPLSNIVSNLIAYILVFVLAMLVLWIVFKILNGVFHLPILHAINTSLGAVLGFIAAILLLAVITWLLHLVLGLLGSDSVITQCVMQSRLYSGFSKWELFGFVNLN